MAAYEISKHFSGLRVQTARRRGRDPFATGFEDDSADEGRKSRNRTKRPTATATAAAAPPKHCPGGDSSSSGTIDARTRETGNDLLDLATHKKSDRRRSPGRASLTPQGVVDGQGRRGSLPGSLPGAPPSTDPKKAVALAAGPLAYLDDSSDDEPSPPRRSNRRPSPAPRQSSDAGSTHRLQSSGRDSSVSRKEQHQHLKVSKIVPKHTVASPFAGTKYLQDSDSEGDEEAVASRQNSNESIDFEPPRDPPEESSKKTLLEVKRVDKPKQNGSGVSWRAFSASRAEQRYAEIDALQASLKQRGRTIAFSAHATTDDGQRVPLSPTPERSSIAAGRAKGQSRNKSPPRRRDDIRPAEDEMADRELSGGLVRLYDPAEYKTNPFADPIATISSSAKPDNLEQPRSMASPTFVSTASVNDDAPGEVSSSPSDVVSLRDSLQSPASKLTVSPQTIPESRTVDHSLTSPLMSPAVETERNPLSRNSSTRSMRMVRPSRYSATRRSSRRSNSANASASPAHAFLSSWARADPDEPPVEPKPDEEGQAIGLDNEYIIGRTLSQGGSGVVKEVHTIENGNRMIRAVKIVRRAVTGFDDAENENMQQEVEHEVSIWRYLKHRHILNLHAVFETDYATFCVMDLNVGGTLFDLVRKSRQNAAQNGGRKGLPPELAATYAYQLACALRYLHEDIRVCHRDVKLENCLIDLTTPNADLEGGNLRLCDFGLADFLHGGSFDDSTAITESYSEYLSLSTELPIATASVIGTLEYASPKGLSVNRKLFETAGDLWAFGVIVYALCTGELPFRHSLPSKTADLILRAEWDETALRQAAAGGEEVIDIVKGCLERDVDTRLTVVGALDSPWFDACREDAEERSPSSGWR